MKPAKFYTVASPKPNAAFLCSQALDIVSLMRVPNPISNRNRLTRGINIIASRDTSWPRNMNDLQNAISYVEHCAANCPKYHDALRQTKIDLL